MNATACNRTLWDLDGETRLAGLRCIYIGKHHKWAFNKEVEIVKVHRFVGDQEYVEIEGAKRSDLRKGDFVEVRPIINEGKAERLSWVSSDAEIHELEPEVRC